MSTDPKDRCEWGDCTAERKNSAAIGHYPRRRLYRLCNAHYTSALRGEPCPAHEEWLAWLAARKAR